MMRIPRFAKAFSLAATLMGLAASAHAATYNMTITTGTYSASDAFLGEFSFALDGRALTVNVSDTFQTLTVDYGHGFYETGLFKTMVISDVVHYHVDSGDNWANERLYSRDGVNFFVDYSAGMIGGQFDTATFTPWSLNFKGNHGNYYGSYHVEYAALVPVPGAVWLFGSALLGLGLQRKRKTV